MPTKENVHGIFAELAHQQLIQKPRHISQCWTSELSQPKAHVEFSSCDSLAEFYLENMPTAKKVVKVIKSRPTNEAEIQCLDFLRPWEVFQSLPWAVICYHSALKCLSLQWMDWLCDQSLLPVGLPWNYLKLTEVIANWRKN